MEKIISKILRRKKINPEDVEIHFAHSRGWFIQSKKLNELQMLNLNLLIRQKVKVTEKKEDDFVVFKFKKIKMS